MSPSKVIAGFVRERWFKLSNDNKEKFVFRLPNSDRFKDFLLLSYVIDTCQGRVSHNMTISEFIHSSSARKSVQKERGEEMRSKTKDEISQSLKKTKID